MVRCDPFAGTKGVIRVSQRTLLDWPAEKTIPLERLKITVTFEESGWEKRIKAANKARSAYVESLGTDAEDDFDDIDDDDVEEIEQTENMEDTDVLE